WKPPAHSPEENMVRQKCSGIRRSYLAIRCHRQNMKTSIINGSEVSRLSVAIHYSQILQPIIIQACEPIKAALTKLTLCQTDRIFIQIWLCQHLL
ncbi:hypothetical protein OSJ99_11600, partial [Escherichia coli]|nr:hypothetical protein [Escherichia coli]